ncbi:MAG: bile acid:sodium symporter family protein [Gammaproteobacteria bacterium]|nr:bile acid:sodium symporter family protein [Gammaproteobacteria bacterium]
MLILRLLANGLAPLTLVGAICAFFFPEYFLPFKHVFKWLFAATMFALGIVLNPAELKDTLQHPARIGLGVLTQYSVMPLFAFTVATLGGLPPALALGFIIVGAAPGAMASNVIVYLAGGAMAFSIAMTTVATFLSPLITPSLVEWLGGALLPIPFWDMMQTIILIVVLPLALGMQLHRFLKGNQLSFAKEFAPALASLAIIIICSYAVAANQTRISNVGIDVLMLVILLNALGYLSGWFLARLYGFDMRHRLALAIEIGMQNAGLGVVLALEHFKDTPETALPGALFAVWCILTAAGATSYLRWKRVSSTPSS